MKTKSTIKLFATTILAAATIGAATVHADAKITRDTANDSVEIISDPYKTFEEADKALNNVKDKYLEEYGSYRAGVNPTEDLKNYEVYAIVRKVSKDETSESVVQNVAKALSHSQSSEKPAPTPEPEKPAPTPEPEKPAKTTNRVKDDKTKTDDSKKDSQNNETTKNKLPETGESSSLLGVIGGLLSIVGLGIFTKRKRG